MPLNNVDPEYDYDKGHPSFKLWYEHNYNFNEEGVDKFKDSPRLYNYNRRAKVASNPLRMDTTRGGLEGRVSVVKKEEEMQVRREGRGS